ncbi:MAG: hypothetical protein OHK0046_31490 [Anaerolineae bacterium]
MPSFAVYYVPPADTPLYQFGTDVLAYDVWTGQFLPEDNATRQLIPAFDPAWATVPQEWGFHMTIGHALEFDAADLPAIETELEDILKLFDPNKPFLLTPAEDYLPLDGPNATLYFVPNQAFMMFHALVVARIHPYASGTPAKRALLAGEMDAYPPVYRERTARYFHYSVLDDWYPHMALLRPIPEAHRDTTRTALLAHVPKPAMLTVDTLCLLLKPDGSNHFHVYRTYSRAV